MLLTKKKQSGFTIVELLIVIVIIGILAALVLNTFTGAQQKARDAKRDTDTKAIATQLEACYNEDQAVASTSCDTTAIGMYPLSIVTGSGVGSTLKSLDPKALIDPKGNAYKVASAFVPAGSCATTTAATAFTSVSFTAPATTVTVASAPTAASSRYIYIPFALAGGPCTASQALCTASCASWALLWAKENGGWQMKVGLN